MILKCNSVIYLLQFYSHHCIAALWFDFVNGFFANKIILWNDKKRAFVFARKLRSTHMLGNASVFYHSIIDFSIIPITQTMIPRPSLLHHFYWSNIIPVSETHSHMVHCNQKLPKGSVCTTAADLQTGFRSEEEEECQWWWWWFYYNSGFANSNSIREGGTPLYWAWFLRPAQCLQYYGDSACLVLLPHRETASRHFTAHFNATDPIYEGKSAYLWTPPPSFLLSSQMFPKLGSIRQNIRHTTNLSPAWSSSWYHTWNQPLTQYTIYRFLLAAYVESPQIYCSKAIPKNHNFINRFCSKQIQISWGFEFVVKLCIINASQSKMD